MKLMTHTSLFWITIVMFLFFLLGVSFYKVFKELSDNRLMEELQAEQEVILTDPKYFIENLDHLRGFLDFCSVDTTELQSTPGATFHDSIMVLPDQPNPIPVICVHFTAKADSVNLHFHICKSTITSDQLTERITLLMTGMALLFVLGLYLLNQHVFNRTWRGFYHTLAKIKKFRAGDLVPQFEESEIDEFEELNMEIKRMAGRILHDYQNLQSFASHATHEFLTPIAVIQAKAELLLQDEHLTEKQAAQLNEIIQFSRQLSRTTQALALLFKIDNNQYPEVCQVSFLQLIRAKEKQIRNSCSIMQITLETDYADDFVVEINPELADLFIMNLINNAVRHNHTEGRVTIRLSRESIRITNTGKNEALDEEKIFKEFQKGNHSGGLGLGLAIVMKIGMQYKLKTSYSFDQKLHSFTITH